MSDHAATDDGEAGAHAVADRAAEHRADHVLARAQDDGRDLRAVAPLCQEREHERLQQHGREVLAEEHDEPPSYATK